jgi:hypothetical protein
VDFNFAGGKQVNIKRDLGVKNCIILQFFSGESRKLHYIAVFWVRKNRSKRQAYRLSTQRRRVHREGHNKIRRAKAGPSELGMTPYAGGSDGLKNRD